MPTLFFYLHDGRWILPALPENPGFCHILILEELEQRRSRPSDFFHCYKVILESGHIVTMRIRPEDEVALRLVN